MESIVFRDDSGLLAFALLAGFHFRLNHLAEDMIANESGTAFGKNLKRLGCGARPATHAARGKHLPDERDFSDDPAGRCADGSTRISGRA
jgi:hypothetical protein